MHSCMFVHTCTHTHSYMGTHKHATPTIIINNNNISKCNFRKTDLGYALNRGGGFSSSLTEGTVPVRLHTLSCPSHPTRLPIDLPMVVGLKALRLRASVSFTCIPSAQKNAECKPALANVVMSVFQREKK